MKKNQTKGFKEQTRVNDALDKFLQELKIRRLQPEEITLTEALGRVLAEDIRSQSDVPYFNRSAVDGYAVRSDDIYGASSTSPIVLDTVGSVGIGQIPSVSVAKLQAVEVATGAPLPEGADAVVMLEYTERISRDKIEVYRPAYPWGDVSRIGEDVRKGEKVLAQGTLLQPQDLGILAAIGMSRVKVVRKPQVGASALL